MALRNGHRIAALNTLLSNTVLKSASNRYIAEFAEFGGKIVDAAKALRAIDEKDNPSESERGHAERLNKEASRLNRRIVHLEGLLLDRFKREQDGINERMAEKVKLTPDAKYEAEIRSIYRSLPNDKQIDFLRQIADANDGPSLAAICCCSPILSGATQERQERFVAYIKARHAPGEVAESKALLSALQPYLTMARTAKEFAGDFGNLTVDDPVKAAAVARDTQAAFDAAAAFEAAVKDVSNEPAPPDSAAA